MIRVTIELCPHGDTSCPIHLGTINIGNTGEGTLTSDEYKAVLFDKSGRRYKCVRVEGFPRKRLLAFDLVYRVLRAAMGQRNP